MYQLPLYLQDNFPLDNRLDRLMLFVRQTLLQPQLWLRALSLHEKTINVTLIPYQKIKWAEYIVFIICSLGAQISPCATASSCIRLNWIAFPIDSLSDVAGEILARDMECLSFREVSASEQVTEVAEAFNDLCREVNIHKRKSKQSLLDRVLGGRGGLRVYARGKSDSALPKD